MLRIILICYTLWVSAEGHQLINCQSAADGNSYRNEELASELQHVSQMVVNWRTNTIYFSYYEPSADYSYLSAALNIETKKLTLIEELPAFCSFAVDQDRGVVYAGCRNNTGLGGLYRYDNNVNKFVRLDNVNAEIRDIAFGEALYYVTLDYTLFKYSEGKGEPVAELENLSIDHLAVNSNGDKAFKAREFQLQKAGTNKIYDIMNIYGLEALTGSPKGDFYACSSPYIYRVDTTTRYVSEAIDVPACYAVATDRDGNLIYSEDFTHTIVRLVKCNT